MPRVYHNCYFCGEQYFKAEVVREMEKLAESKEKPIRLIEVPMRELAASI